MLEETKKRLANIQAIEPYLNAMRNTSLGNWKIALNRIQAIHQYRGDLIDIYTAVTASASAGNKKHDLPDINPKQQIWLVVGSQKGLVSNFNRRLIGLIEKEIGTLRSSIQFTLPHVYVVTNKPSYYQSLLSQTAYQAEVIPFVYDLTFSDAVQLLNQIPSAGDPAQDVYYFYNAYGKSQNSTAMKQAALKNHALEITSSQNTAQWPPYILDSEASAIGDWIQNMLTYLEFQEVLTNSIASENSFRHRILEEAKNNTDRLIHELTIEISMSRKKEITKEIQELAVAAGLIQ